ncbi:MAG: Ppx/GppA family phosphatase, partial [Candidatus Dadabacteria bacterium]|nr:Ppx/GppA family phosphatase [Candidatus Dadabacteria bacterium]NIT14808.1 Ppx/GppA family phosphatase [Candidatus Dadabacteria bacterium]
MNFASIDLGTNTFRLLVANLHDHNEIEFLHKKSTVCALGRGFNTLDRTLSYGSINRCLKVIKEFNQILTDFNVNNLRAVATSIVRQSTNSHLFTVPAANILNNKIEVISGKNEAELTTLGVLNSIDNIANNKLIVDIGGGSTEFAFVDKY